MDVFAHIAEQKIRAAQERGEFDNLSLKGQPLDLRQEPFVPDELRMAYKILKNAGIVPEEVALQQEMATLRSMLAHCIDPDRRSELSNQLASRTLRYNLLLERIGGSIATRTYGEKLSARLIGSPAAESTDK